MFFSAVLPKSERHVRKPSPCQVTERGELQYRVPRQNTDGYSQAHGLNPLQPSHCGSKLQGKVTWNFTESYTPNARCIALKGWLPSWILMSHLVVKQVKKPTTEARLGSIVSFEDLVIAWPSLIQFTNTNCHKIHSQILFDCIINIDTAVSPEQTQNAIPSWGQPVLSRTTMILASFRQDSFFRSFL